MCTGAKRYNSELAGWPSGLSGLPVRLAPLSGAHVDGEQEELGIDDVELGEFAYDFVEITRDLKPRTSVEEEYEEDDEDHSAANIVAGQKMHGESYPMRSMSRPPLDEQEGPETYRSSYQGPFQEPAG